MRVFWRIVRAIAAKELRQIARDRLTAALLVGVPLAQLLLFGFAIELAPRHWPTAWVARADGNTSASAPPDALALRAQAALEAGAWFHITHRGTELRDAEARLARGEVAFIVVWPADAAARLLRDERPDVQLIADLSDPFAAAALSALRARGSRDTAFDPQWPIHLQIDARHAPQRGSGEYLVPALAGVILTLTLTLLAALSIVREVERGSWAGLLTTPAGAGAIVLGKLLPYLGLGSLLFALLIALAHTLFGTALGSPALGFAAALFMLANLGLGLALSCVARTQMQAMQMGIFFYLPSILLSGFMFPFHAMPGWARSVGELLPLTHFLRCLRASLVRGADAATVLSLAAPIGLFALLAIAAALALAHRRVG